jgi:hypothetical protein
VGTCNYLIDGVSASGKTAVCHELQRRGFQAINGDTELAYQGDPYTGAPTGHVRSHWHHLWNADLVRALVADRCEHVTFFCGGARNLEQLEALFDAVFVLELDRDTLSRRLDKRPADELGSSPSERALILRLHASGQSTVPTGIPIDATAPLSWVVDELLRGVGMLPNP